VDIITVCAITGLFLIGFLIYTYMCEIVDYVKHKGHVTFKDFLIAIGIVLFWLVLGGLIIFALYLFHSTY